MKLWPLLRTVGDNSAGSFFFLFFSAARAHNAPRVTPRAAWPFAVSDLKTRYSHLGGIQESVIFSLGRHWEGKLRLGPV